MSINTYQKLLLFSYTVAGQMGRLQSNQRVLWGVWSCKPHEPGQHHEVCIQQQQQLPERRVCPCLHLQGWVRIQLVWREVSACRQEALNHFVTTLTSGSVKRLKSSFSQLSNEKRYELGFQGFLVHWLTRPRNFFVVSNVSCFTLEIWKTFKK